jgi:hypothetical protein
MDGLTRLSAVLNNGWDCDDGFRPTGGIAGAGVEPRGGGSDVQMGGSEDPDVQGGGSEIPSVQLGGSSDISGEFLRSKNHGGFAMRLEVNGC